MVEQIVSDTLVIQKYAINNRIQNVLNSLNSKAISGKNIMNYTIPFYQKVLEVENKTLYAFLHICWYKVKKQTTKNKSKLCPESQAEDQGEKKP